MIPDCLLKPFGKKGRFSPKWLWIVLGTLLFCPQLVCAAGPIKVADAYGNTITLSEVPRRIACLYAFCGHVVTMLDRGDHIVAVVNGLKKDVILRQLVPRIDTIPVPARGGTIHMESLLDTRPDIVFLKPETAANKAEIRKLDRFGLPFLVVGYRSMAGQMRAIEMMGRAVGTPDKARDYTRYYREVIRIVTLRTQDIPDDRRVRVYHAVNEPTRTDGPGTIEADWTRACGVINVSVGQTLHQKGEKRFAGMEQILIWDPEVIIVNEEGVDQAIRSDPKWSAIRAVRENKVFAIPVGISRWGHPGGLETPLAMLWTAKTVYPHLFQDIDMEKRVREFYRMFFNLDLDPVMIQRILSNQGMRKSLSPG